jgi:hypothetical protein
MAEVCCAGPRWSVRVGLPVADEREQRSVARPDHVDAFTTIALEQSDREFVRAATDDPPDAAGKLPALQDVYRIVGHEGDCSRYRVCLASFIGPARVEQPSTPTMTARSTDAR